MESGLAVRNGGRIGLVALIAILLLGLGLRVGYAWDGRAPVYDAQAYAAIAANLERGEGFTVGAGATQPSTNYSPGLPLAVAAVYEVAGGVHERTARVVLAVVAWLAVLFAYLLGRRLGRPLPYPPRAGVVGTGGGFADGTGNRAGVVAGLIGALAVAVYPAFLEYGGMLMSEPLAATLLSGGVLALFWARDGGSVWRWLVPGLTLGALALVRPEYLAVGFLLAVVVACSEAWLSFVPHTGTKLSHGWRGIACGALVLVGISVVVAPWTVRNALALDRFVPVSTGGGQVLYAGTYLPSNGDPERVGAEVVAENPELFSPGDAQSQRLEQILARLAAHNFPDLESDEALSKMGKEQLWDDVSEEPLEYAGFVATKVWRIWSHGPRDVMREPIWEALHWALVALGLVGLILLAWRRRWEALVLATIFVSITVISALLVASPRRVLVMTPLVAACAGLGATWLGCRLRLSGVHRTHKVANGEGGGTPG
jgi:hypothetical protein